MPKKSTKKNEIRAHILANPGSTIRKVAIATGAGIRTINRIRAELVEEGLLPPSRMAPQDGTSDNFVKEAEEKLASPEILSGKTLLDLANSETFDAELIDDVEVQNKLMREVRIIAFNAKNHPDIRLSAIQIWTKLKDLEKTQDLGPGPPRTKDEILSRMVRLMKAIGPRLVLEAIDIAFPRSKTLENLEINQSEAPLSPSQTPNPS